MNKELLVDEHRQMMLSEEVLIRKCKENDRKAQNQLFHQYAPLMLSICQRYLKQRETAEDIMIDAFYRIMSKIHSFEGNGSFEGWMKRIVVNECLMELRRRKNQYLTVAIEEMTKPPEVDFVDHLVYEELIRLLDELPQGYRTVFNLYVIEGFKHKEIAEKLGISINTSKSQLILARRKLQALIKKKYRQKMIAC